MDYARLLILERAVKKNIYSILSKMVDLVYQKIKKNNIDINLFQFNEFRDCLIDAIDSIDTDCIGNIILWNMFDCLPLIEKYVRSNKEELILKFYSHNGIIMDLFKKIVESVPEID